MAMVSPLTGTITILVTEIESGAQLWERHGSAMQAAHRRQELILATAAEGNDGQEFKTIGDSFHAAFPTAEQALRTVLDGQRDLQSEEWGEIGALRVRMALHSGVVEEGGEVYSGPLLNRAMRLLSVGHGGQVLLSEVTYELVRDTLPSGVTLLDLGEHRLRDATQPEHIYQMVVAGLQGEFPPLKTIEGYPTNLPLQSTPFIGREKQVVEVRERLLRPEVRLLTLTGPGGIGKTRLALQVATEMLAEFADGVFFINLASISDPNLVIPMIARTLGLQESGGEPITDILKEYLRDKRLLLVLDNFEQVVAAASQIADMLNAAPQVKVLVTSRAPLRLSAEHEYQVQPLKVPDPKRVPPETTESLSQYEAVALFIRRAAAVKQGFTVDNQNAPAVAEICYRLEGIPLAIELAAARIKVLSPQALLVRLGSKLQLLTGGGRDLDARQQTLRNTIAWSYDLLTEDEKQLFRRMAVFRGGATLEAVEEVCGASPDDGREFANRSSMDDRRTASSQQPVAVLSPLQVDPLDGITSLVDKSLMYSVESSGGGEELRYQMLETINEYAREKLEESGESQSTQRRHALYFMRLAEQLEPELVGARQAERMAMLDDEYDNLRAALAWSREPSADDGREFANRSSIDDSHQPKSEVGLRIGAAIWRFWAVRGYYSEGREQLEAALAADDRRRTAASGNGPHATSQQLHYRAKALTGAGVLTHFHGEHEAARALHEEALGLYRAVGDKKGMGTALNSLAILVYEQGDYATATTLHEESLALKREIGDKRGIAISLTNLGNIAYEQGDYAKSRAQHEESLALAREAGDQYTMTSSLTNIGNVAQSQGDYDTARASHEESLALSRELGDQWGIGISLANLGNVAFEQGDYELARTRQEESMVIKKEIGDKRGIGVSLTNLGGVDMAEGKYDSAFSLLSEALTIQMELGDKWAGASTLIGLGRLAIARSVDRGKDGSNGQDGAARGVRILGAVETLLENLGAKMEAVERVQYESSLDSARTLLGEEVFKSAWEEGRAMSVEQAVQYALQER